MTLLWSLLLLLLGYLHTSLGLDLGSATADLISSSSMVDFGSSQEIAGDDEPVGTAVALASDSRGSRRRNQMKQVTASKATEPEPSDGEFDEPGQGGQQWCWLCENNIETGKEVWRWRTFCLHKSPGCASALRCHNTLLRTQTEQVKLADARHMERNPKSWKTQVMPLKGLLKAFQRPFKGL